MLFSRSFTVFVFLLLVSKTLQQRSLKDLPEECFTATAIYDETRIFSYVSSTSDDLLLRKGWYRFSGQSANSLKEGFEGLSPSRRDGKNNPCAAVYPGTLMSTHPTADEGITSILVCFRHKDCFNGNVKNCPCKSKRLIYVRNCIRHYIYWLVPTGHHERYCTGKTWLSKPITSTNSSDALECENYKTIRDASRIWDSMSRVHTEDEEGWVRFDRVAGTEIASKCVASTERGTQAVQHCGAKFRGWMDGIHPSVLEGRVSRRVCFSYADKCTCEIYSNIAVRNCGRYFVYYLHTPPVENARYCGASQKSQPEPDGIKRTSFETKNICNKSKNITGIDRLWSFTDPTVFKCDANLFGAYSFRHKNIPFSIKEGCNKSDVIVIETRCASLYQGYMEGRHPTVSEGYVDRIVCFQYHQLPCECHFTTVIGVQNCGDRYVYDLKGVPMCDARFCMAIDKKHGTTAEYVTHSVYGGPSNYELKPAPKHDSDGNTVTDDNLLFNTFLLACSLLLCLILVVIILVTVLLVRLRLKKKSKH